jgi:predicted component of type VI protein secretion system
MKSAAIAALFVLAAVIACGLLIGCEDSTKSKKTPISGTATYPKATFPKGEKLE